MDKVLIAITTYNQLEYTKLFYKSFKQIDSNLFDLLVIDDASTDDTVEWCKENNIKYVTKDVGNGLTNSWNIAYKYFKKNRYKYIVLANNDILVPKGAIEELKIVLDRWPCSLVVPLSTNTGCGHNKLQSIDMYYGEHAGYNDHENYQSIQNLILSYKQQQLDANNLYLLDPIRMKMFNGFFFMMSRDICQYERKDGNLFDPEFINVKNEDEFNWSNLIPNNDFPMLCKTSFVYHFKGVSFTKAGIKYSNNLKEHIEQRNENITNSAK